MATIAANLRLEPADAVAYFRSKGMEITWDWQDMRREAHAQAFTVAKATSLDVLRTIRDMVDKSISTGMTFEEFQKALRPQLQDLGWWGTQEVLDGETGELTKAQLGSTRRLRTIYQTNIQTANMAGRYKRMLDNVDNQPYWRYVAVMDGRTRPAHRALHGKVWRWDDPIWDVIFPPNGWGCRCRVQALSEEEFKRLGVPLEDGSDAIQTVQVPINKAGDTMDVRVVRYTDEAGRERIFRPDPGWDYNPGADYASEQALSRVLGEKIDKVPPEMGAAVAANIARAPEAQQLLDSAWQSWAGDVLDDAAARERQMLLGFVRPDDVDALAARDVQVESIPVVADDNLIVRGKEQLPEVASGPLSRTDWLDLSSTLREPQAVLVDRTAGTLLYVLPRGGDDGQRIVVASAYGQNQSKRLSATVRLAYIAAARALQSLLESDGVELVDGSLD
ncbi:phage minor head protein [Burkholderia cenocepacia]|uniref:phage head morphogenesis protein n=1 Tax=Burkholderia cenocepacia TaxID=95486 RepID=UPI0026530C9A|nr:phage minor head protein [Burkholderia cenocepacia]MDN7821702.1 phage minor head protein [Burkholderia cenocepacia]